MSHDFIRGQSVNPVSATGANCVGWLGLNVLVVRHDFWGSRTTVSVERCYKDENTSKFFFFHDPLVGAGGYAQISDCCVTICSVTVLRGTHWVP